MQKVQIPWVRISAQLTQALRTSSLSLPALAKAANVQYHAVYRMRRDGVKNRGKNALTLCRFFEIEVDAIPSVSAEALTAAVLDSWDGTPEHGQLLLDLTRCARQYRVAPKAALQEQGDDR